MIGVCGMLEMWCMFQSGFFHHDWFSKTTLEKLHSYSSDATTCHIGMPCEADDIDYLHVISVLDRHQRIVHINLLGIN